MPATLSQDNWPTLVFLGRLKTVIGTFVFLRISAYKTGMHNRNNNDSEN